jgi:hypothetical protein
MVKPENGWPVHILVKKVISCLWKDLHPRPDRGRLSFLWQWAPLTQRHIKGDTLGHGNQCSLCPHNTPQTLIAEPIT